MRTSAVYYGGQAGSTNAWAIRLSDGRYMNDTSSDVMATAYNGDDGSTQAGAPLPFPRMRDNGS